MRLVGERKAAAALVLAVFGLFFLINALAAPPSMGLGPMMYSLAAVYLVGFFGLVSGWFWARWYSMGVALSGVAMGVLMAWQIGFEPVVLIWGGLHLLIALALAGRGAAAAFDSRKDWRERFRMDENAANRLGKSVLRAGASLPYLIMAALAPKQGMDMTALLALGAAAAGLAGLARLRTWGVLALAGAAALVLSGGWVHSVQTLGFLGTSVELALMAPLAAVLLVGAVVPFLGPIARTLARGR